MCGRSECNATASNVPDGESNYQRGAGAFPSGLKRDWGYVNVKGLIWNRCEVQERLPWMEGANCSCWSTWSGGSNGQSQQMVQDSKYGKRQSDFKQISVIGACMTFTNWITWVSSRWNDVWGWVRICVNRNEFISSDQRYSFQKNLDIPLYIAPTGYIRRKIIQNGTLLTTIQILATFWDQNFKVFIWRDLEGNISGNRLLGLLNIVPARDLAISSYFSCSENWFLCEFAK